jgi:hypothetical protein
LESDSTRVLGIVPPAVFKARLLAMLADIPDSPYRSFTRELPLTEREFAAVTAALAATAGLIRPDELDQQTMRCVLKLLGDAADRLGLDEDFRR